MSQKSFQNQVRKIDRNLDFVEKYMGGHFLYFVFKVIDKKGTAFILKSSPKTENEINLLERLKNVKNITQIKNIYSSRKKYEYPVILKEYAEGETLLEKEEKIREPFLQMQLADIVRECHKKRIAYLDVHKRNFVISSDRKNITYIDVDYADFFEKEDEKAFEAGKKEDIRDLESLFGWR